MKTNFKWSRSTSISFHNFRVHGQHALSYVPPLQGSHIKRLRRTQWVVYVWDRETEVRVGLPLRKGMSEGLKERERVPSLGAGRPMWLGLPLFVFPTQSDMTGAISTPSHSHSQGPLSTNLPLLMIHSSVKGTMFAYGTASCTWHHQNIFLHGCSKYIGLSLLWLKLTEHQRSDPADICNFLRMMEISRSSIL